MGVNILGGSTNFWGVTFFRGSTSLGVNNCGGNKTIGGSKNLQGCPLFIVYCHYIAPISIAIIYRAMMTEMCIITQALRDLLKLSMDLAVFMCAGRAFQMWAAW